MRRHLSWKVQTLWTERVPRKHFCLAKKSKTEWSLISPSWLLTVAKRHHHPHHQPIMHYHFHRRLPLYHHLRLRVHHRIVLIWYHSAMCRIVRNRPSSKHWQHRVRVTMTQILRPRSRRSLRMAATVTPKAFSNVNTKSLQAKKVIICFVFESPIWLVIISLQTNRMCWAFTDGCMPGIQIKLPG